MSKTVTIRMNEDTYEIIKSAASGEKRTISNFMEYAALKYLTSSAYIDDKEMEEILDDTELVSNLKEGLKEVKKGKFKVVL
ncbi:MAG: CopG family transcriptional regulator [Ignavibacteriae bacterium]|jgi:uncharacterized protein (DUF1778 family)|nr:CopG family transcriptional regulator [Ignavibacteriota bacterium]NOG98474.1 CopG family transcriptional regulator [Ignavibacteriota bacterium]